MCVSGDGRRRTRCAGRCRRLIGRPPRQYGRKGSPALGGRAGLGRGIRLGGIRGWPRRREHRGHALIPQPRIRRNYEGGESRGSACINADRYSLSARVQAVEGHSREDPTRASVRAAAAAQGVCARRGRLRGNGSGASAFSSGISIMNAMSPNKAHSIHSGGSPLIGQRPGRRGDHSAGRV